MVSDQTIVLQIPSQQGAGYLMPNASFVEEQRWQSGIREFMSKCINPKVNIIARLEFELASLNVTIQLVSNYVHRDSPR